jgi:hypothetical protein
MAHKYVIDDTTIIHHYGPYTIGGSDTKGWCVVYGGLLSTEFEEFKTLDQATEWIDAKEEKDNGQ